MRWIFFTLLFINLGLTGYLWAQHQGWVAIKKPAGATLSYAPTAGVAPVLMLSEAPVGPPPAVVPPVDAPTAAPASLVVTPVDEHRLCLMYGPYERTEDAAAVVSRLAAVEIQSHIHEIEIHLSSNFQVYLAPLANRAAAKSALDTLLAKGIDSYIIPKGELNNGIALGSFDNEKAAKEQVQLLAQKGVEAKVRDSVRPLKETWVALAPEAGDTMGSDLKTSLLKNQLIEERQILCTAIASP